MSLWGGSCSPNSSPPAAALAPALVPAAFALASSLPACSHAHLTNSKAGDDFRLLPADLPKDSFLNVGGL